MQPELQNSVERYVVGADARAQRRKDLNVKCPGSVSLAGNEVGCRSDLGHSPVGVVAGFVTNDVAILVGRGRRQDTPESNGIVDIRSDIGYRPARSIRLNKVLAPEAVPVGARASRWRGLTQRPTVSAHFRHAPRRQDSKQQLPPTAKARLGWEKHKTQPRSRTPDARREG